MKAPLKEDAVTEFKSSFTEKAIETLVAFANTKGGKVLIGIDDQGTPLKGFTIGTESIQTWLNEIKNKTQPSIIPDAEIITYNDSNVAELSIKEFPIKPVSFRGRYFKRVKNSNHQLNTSEINDMYMQSLQLSWDSYPYNKALFEDLNVDKIRLFMRKVNDGGRFVLPDDPYEALTILKMVKAGEVTNAAMILFSKENLFYNVHVGRFKTPSFIIDERMIRGNLFDVVDETLKFINSHLKVAFEITGVTTQRTEIFEYPIAAIRELVLNSVIHRDFLSPSDIQIKIFDQSITFYNPGKLYGDISIEDLKKDAYTSKLRNKLIAEAFYLTKDIEKYGTGFFRVRKEIKQYPTMTFKYQEQVGGFVTELAYKAQKTSTLIPSDTVNDTVNGTLNDTVNKDRLSVILEEIFKNNHVSIDDLAKTIDVSRRTLIRDLDKLKEQGRISRVGSDKTGYWQVSI
ncbi:RNA-binding domain-containing protein [Pedobacter sp. MC2016-24]|uniref:RNA-binding domain-containing protein n=1 Tax=Pedobacter sp. MC2016-24 TaxID=2780090 RepID=UPI00187FD2F2|nr:RNA-binding domain-containing protein [Pedobacter sp. MC2016-24]MBE9601880.1 putative DNA binding domain-containing protein [Pedobacter sp. MC2016-24]